MKHYQDTETGQIYAFDDGINVAALKNKNLSKSLSETVLNKPSPDHVWLSGEWVDKKLVPSNYVEPISSVPIFNPAWVAFLQPYTLVTDTSEPSSLATLEQINNNTYDNALLSQVVTILPNYAKGNQRAILITRDGCVAIPRLDPAVFDNAQAAEDLNRIFCQLLIGGVHTEVIGLQDVCGGSLNDTQQIFCYSPNLHSRLRNKWAGLTETINLLHPRFIETNKLKQAYQLGFFVTDTIKNLTPFFLLAGYTSFSRGNRSGLTKLNSKI